MEKAQIAFSLYANIFFFSFIFPFFFTDVGVMTGLGGRGGNECGVRVRAIRSCDFDYRVKERARNKLISRNENVC